jgi:hypothetical protein
MASLPLIRTIALDGCYWPTPLRMGATEVIVGETESLARRNKPPSSVASGALPSRSSGKVSPNNKDSGVPVPLPFYSPFHPEPDVLLTYPMQGIEQLILMCHP